jgi:hypothetical protein
MDVVQIILPWPNRIMNAPTIRLAPWLSSESDWVWRSKPDIEPTLDQVTN